jgi:hypothetical protein
MTEEYGDTPEEYRSTSEGYDDGTPVSSPASDSVMSCIPGLIEGGSEVVNREADPDL